MANFNFTVDTDPMAKEIKTVSRRVDIVTGSVIAMQTAVIKAEKEGADLVCSNVNKGFYSLIQSQISQKIAALTSQIDAKLMDLGHQAMALRAIQKRMERDYNMISNNYNKLFNSLNTSLYKRIQEIDKPVVRLVHSDLALVDSRINGSIGSVSTNQNETVFNSQLILASKTKNDGVTAIEAIHKYIREVNLQKKQSESVMSNIKVDNVSEIYVPISVSETTNELGGNSVRYYTPISNISVIDETIDKSVQQNAMSFIRNGEWESVPTAEKQTLDSEFSAMLSNSKMDDRVKQEIYKLYNAASDVKRLKGSEL
ncbi:MAG: hypothetical protein R3Y51_01055 [Rikenellaceae bacterium]